MVFKGLAKTSAGPQADVKTVGPYLVSMAGSSATPIKLTIAPDRVYEDKATAKKLCPKGHSCFGVRPQFMDAKAAGVFMALASLPPSQ